MSKIDLDSFGWLLPVAALLYCFYQFFAHHFNHWKKHGIPGPAVNPFFENYYSPFTSVPKLQVQRSRQYGKIYGIYFRSRPALMISDPVIIKRILTKDFWILCNRIEGPKHHPNLDEDLSGARDLKWKRIRSICSPLFTAAKIRKMHTIVDRCIRSMMAVLSGHAEQQTCFAINDLIARYTMDVIASCAFGIDIDAHNETKQANPFVANAKAIFSPSKFRQFIDMSVPEWLLNRLALAGLPVFREKPYDFFATFAIEIIRKRKEATSPPKPDLLQMMMDLRHETNDDTDRPEAATTTGHKYLTETEIASQVFIFLVGGFETTAMNLSNCLYELAMNPDIQQRLYEEIVAIHPAERDHLIEAPYLNAVISEALRKYPPALLLARQATGSYHIPEINYTMKRDECVVIPVYDIHHQEEYWPEPERFDPERFMPENQDRIIPYTYLPFGAGPRHCIGMIFSIHEMKLGLADIIRQFRLLRTKQTPSKLDIGGVFFLEHQPVYIKISHRKPEHKPSM